MSRRRMHDHSLWLINHKHIRILIQNRQRNVFRNDIRFNCLRDLKFDPVTFPQFIICLYAFPIYYNLSFLQYFLKEGTGQILRIRKKPVNAFSRLIFRYFQYHLISCTFFCFCSCKEINFRSSSLQKNSTKIIKIAVQKETYRSATLKIGKSIRLI